MKGGNMTYEINYHGFEKTVQELSNRYVKLVVDHKRMIFLDGKPIDYKLCANGFIYDMNDNFVSNLSVEGFLKDLGLIKWFFNKKKPPSVGHFLFKQF